MTLAIELPKELEQELLQQTNVNEFVQEAIKKLLLEQKQAAQQNTIQNDQEQHELMAMINTIKPVKAPLSSEEMLRLIRADKTEEIHRIAEARKGHHPITQQFIGLLAGSNLDESDYKKYLEEKYR